METAKEVLDSHLESLDCCNTETEVAMYYRAIDAMEYYAKMYGKQRDADDIIGSAKKLFEQGYKLGAVKKLKEQGWTLKESYDYCQTHFETSAEKEYQP